MDFSLFYQLKNNRPQLMAALFYLAIALLVVSVVSYGMFFAKTFLQKREIAAVDAKLAVYGTAEEKASEKAVFTYKKKIDDFKGVLAGHKVFSNVFSFIETHTLPSVSFSNFSVFQNNNQVELSGQTKDLQTLGSQVNIFETSKDYIVSTNLTNSQPTEAGSIKFSLTLVLNPHIFDYSAPTNP